MYCLNCGSSDIEHQIAESPSDDMDEWWCGGCDLLVDVVSEITGPQFAQIRARYLETLELIRKLNP